MKRMLSVLISLSLLLALLPACGQVDSPAPSDSPPPGTESLPVQPEPAPAEGMDVVINYLLEACAGELAGLEGYTVTKFGESEDFPRMVEETYGIPGDQVVDGFVIDDTGGAPFELFVLRVTDRDEAIDRMARYAAEHDGREELKEEFLVWSDEYGYYLPRENLQAYQDALNNRPQLIARGASKEFVYYLYCQNCEGIRSSLASVITSVEWEQLEPEPVEGMDLLVNCLLEACAGELAGLGGYTVTKFGESEDFPRMVEETYGIPGDQVVDGFVIDDTGDALFELIVLRMTDDDAAMQGSDVLDAYKDRLKEPFFERAEDGAKIVTEENGEAYSLIGQSHRARQNEYLWLLICQDSEKVHERFHSAVLEVWRAQEEPQPTPQPQAMEIAEGVYFIDIAQPEAVGEADPDHPGRVRYVQPGEEDMSLYDTSAITAAWAGGDPEELSAQDRAIYDGAKAVLERILQDGMSEFAKEAAIYEWVLQNVEYDWTHTDVMAETPRESYTPYGGVVNRKAVCLGYASTIQLLMELAGIECITVVGAAQGGDHAWNQVRLDGEWYCVDVTWDWSYWEDGTMKGREWRYFNTTSDYMARTNHQWDYDNVPEAAAEDHGRP